MPNLKVENEEIILWNDLIIKVGLRELCVQPRREEAEEFPFSVDMLLFVACAQQIDEISSTV